MIHHGNLGPSFCTNWHIRLLLKNALLDENLTYLSQKEIKGYPGKLYKVGEVDVTPVPPRKESSDDVCAKFCLENDCDFLTSDKRAYDKIFSEKQIKLIEIIRILEKEPTIDRPVYRLRFKKE